jgi:hypothetical protein
MLYNTMTALAPQVETPANQQLAMIKAANQVIETALAEGARATKAAKESEREIEQAIVQAVQGKEMKNLPKLGKRGL